ncbi:hypothetical protein K0M31_012360 [Melipona bicolor]|uniref:Uncharacterized protein n=1 Tax=Melipona bicolor TaxID=60889 RepID=A0AA40FJP6_9HYME|nr:hypothetical protein K0M31_012360 [Melipona bicolor]
MAAVTDKLRHGIPEMDIPPIEPFNIGTLVLIDIPNFKVVGSEVKLRGLTTYHVNFLHHDVEKQEITMNITFPNFAIDAVVNVTSPILFPIEETGNILLSGENLSYKILITYVKTNHSGKRPFYYSSLDIKLFVLDFDVKFRGQHQQKSLDEAIEMTVRNNKKEIVEANLPNMEKITSEKTLKLLNNFVKHFTYDDLHPDRE